MRLIERQFPGLDSEYNYISIPSLRARAYSMTAENLAANALHWSQPGCYDYSFAAMLARLAESFLETARREPTSSDLDQTFLGLSIGLALHDRIAS